MNDYHVLAEAIRAGAKLARQGHGEYNEYGKTCALGAAYHARFGALPPVLDTGDSDYTIFDSLRSAFPVLEQTSTSCPVEGCGVYLRAVNQRPTSTLTSTISHLNDGHEWTREAIADWLDTLGQQQEVPA